MKPAKTIFSEALPGLQKRRELTQDEMATQCGVKLRTYTKWLSGPNKPRHDNLQKLLKIADDEFRSMVGLGHKLSGGQVDAPALAVKKGGKMSDEDAQWLTSKITLERWAEMLYERSVKGDTAAQRQLEFLAREAERRGGDVYQARSPASRRQKNKE